MSAIWAVLAYRIRLPLWLPLAILAAVLAWGWLDKTSAVRQAVNNLVAGSEIAAAQAERDLAKLNARLLDERLKTVDMARDEIERGSRALEEKLRTSEEAQQELTDAIEDLLQADTGADIPVGDPLCRRLLNCR